MVGSSNNSSLLSFSPYNICESARHRFCMRYKMIDPEGADICDKNYEMFVRMTEEASVPALDMYYEDEDPYYEDEEEPMDMGFQLPEFNINSLIVPIALGGALLVIGYLAFS